MSSLLDQHPDFELLELESELILQFKKYQSLKPLQTGHIVPQFTLSNDFNAWQQFFNGAETHSYLPIKQFSSKPLVISFYSHHWKQQGLDYLNQLNEIHSEIWANGGNMIVITDSRSHELEKLAWENNLTLNFYFDTSRKIAQHFGVYHKNSPVWERFSGVDEHVPLLASFVVTPYRQIVFDYTNWDMEKTFSADRLLQEVYQSGLYLNTHKSA